MGNRISARLRTTGIATRQSRSGLFERSQTRTCHNQGSRSSDLPAAWHLRRSHIALPPPAMDPSLVDLPRLSERSVPQVSGCLSGLFTGATAPISDPSRRIGLTLSAVRGAGNPGFRGRRESRSRSGAWWVDATTESSPAGRHLSCRFRSLPVGRLHR